MKNAKTLSLSATVWLLAAILIGVPGPWTGTASAAVNCSTVTSTDSTDTDDDGIPDYYECNEFTFYRGGTTFPGLLKKTASAPRKDYLDPNSKDLFVVMSRSASGSQISNITNDTLFQDITEATGTGGLGVTIHFLDDCSKLSSSNATTCLTSGNPDRRLSSQPGMTQWAARVVEESSSSSGTNLGNTPVGIPSTPLVFATVYTLRTKNYTTTNVCNDTTSFTKKTIPNTAVFKCYENRPPYLGRYSGIPKSDLSTDTTTLLPLIDLYHRQNLAHETGHMMNLVPGTMPNPSTPGETITVTGNPPHYASSETGSIMESGVYYKRNVTSSGGTINGVEVIWYMPGSFVDTDRSNMSLR